MPTREQTMADAVRLFANADYPTGMNVSSAWLGIYQALLWYEPVNWLDFDYLPHIIDADKLRPSSSNKKKSWSKPGAWQLRASKVNNYLASVLGCAPDHLLVKTDLLMRLPNYVGMQRQNTLGIAFIGLVKHVLDRFGSKDVLYKTEVDAGAVFPGITFLGRSSTPRIDLLVERDGVPRTVISAKWSLRHDRMSDLTNECPVYKAAYERVFRGLKRDRMSYYVITNEFDPSRLNKILDDTCVDGVIHIHKPMVVEVCELDGRLGRLIDLKDFINYTLSW